VLDRLSGIGSVIVVSSAGLKEAAAWLQKYRQLWAARFDELDRVVEDLKRREKSDERRKRG
jgi:hypothetical protein